MGEGGEGCMGVWLLGRCACVCLCGLCAHVLVCVWGGVLGGVE